MALERAYGHIVSVANMAVLKWCAVQQEKYIKRIRKKFMFEECYMESNKIV